MLAGVAFGPCLGGAQRAKVFPSRRMETALKIGTTVMRDRRRRLRLRLLALAPIVCAASVQAQPAFEDRWGWNYCAPPYPPSCVKKAGADVAATKACAENLERYLASLFAYRDCKAREVQRAILEANRVSSAFKCRTEKKYCDLSKEDR